MERPAAGGGRPPRKPSNATWSTIYSPYAGPVKASPRASKLFHQKPAHGPSTRPKRPLSASRVASTTSSRMAQTSPRPNSARPARPTSASQARYIQVETIAFPMSESCESCLSPPPSVQPSDIQESDSTSAMQVKLQALLEMWGEEQRGFRSSVLFCETTFNQAKALASRMPRPNTFLSAVVFGCLTQMGNALDEQYPFLVDIIEELGAAMYSNFTELQCQLVLEERHPSALLFERGKPWFHEVTAQKTRCQSFQTSSDASKNEIRILTEMLHEARNANSAAIAASLQSPQRDDTFDEYYIPPVFRLGDLSVESMKEEVLTAFTNLSDTDARQLLSQLLENAAERDMPKLPDTLAQTVGHMKGQDRREFLRECYDYVTPNELQDSLHARDELNDDKRYQVLVNDLHELLQLQPQENLSDPKADPSPNVALFHSEEARIGKRVHELIELVQDVAVEVSFFEPKHQALLPDTLLQRLRIFESSAKRVKLEPEIRQRKLLNGIEDVEIPRCECVCGHHRLINLGEVVDEIISEVPVENGLQKDDAAKKQKPRRKSSAKRPPSAHRKNAISFDTRSPRKSSAFMHIFSLAEVCHIVSAVLHLQFSRDAAEISTQAGSGAVSVLTFDEQWSFLRQDTSARTFKTLAKDYLVRKYGIKSIAIMHTLQLERSLVHYSSQGHHVRCELFSWFFGADKARVQSKDFAFAFFQKLVKCILNLFTMKKTSRSNSITSTTATPQLQSIAYSSLVTLWAECIGDGESVNLRSIPSTLALEACKQSFPPAMQQTSHFESFREQLHRRGSEQKVFELEMFFHEVMETWEVVFDGQMQDVLKTLETVGVLDLDGFSRCLAANELEFTTGERYELFDLLVHEGDENVIQSKKMVQFIMEAKYLKLTL